MYSDLFGPESTVIHNVTRNILEELKNTNTVEVFRMGPDSCQYMGMMTAPASETSDATLIFSRPASPDDKILREIFVKNSRKVKFRK